MSPSLPDPPPWGGLALVEGIVGQLLGSRAGPWLPFALGTAREGCGDPAQWKAALAIPGYVAAFAIVGFAVTARRDIA